jgi:uncharacterized protein
MHVHLWEGRYEENKREIVKACRVYNIDYAFVTGMSEDLARNPDEDSVHKLNSEVYHFAKQYPDIIRGLAYINPLNKNVLKELRECVEDYAFIGMKVKLPVNCDNKTLFPVYEKCIQYDIPILFHSWQRFFGNKQSESSEDFRNLAEIYPELRICMSHLGGITNLKAVSGYKNIWADISGSMLERERIVHAIDTIGVDRILFGTDMPVPGSFLITLGKVEDLELTPKEKDKIYYLNTLNWLRKKS